MVPDNATAMKQPGRIPLPGSQMTPPGAAAVGGAPQSPSAQGVNGGMDGSGSPRSPLFPNGMQVQRLASGEPANPQEQEQIRQAVALGQGKAQDPQNAQALQQIMQQGQGEDVTDALAGFATAMVEQTLQQIAQQGGMSSAQWLAIVMAVIGSVSEMIVGMGAQIGKQQIAQFASTTMANVRNMMIQNGWASQQEMQQVGQIVKRSGAGGKVPQSGMQRVAGPGSVPPGHERVSQAPPEGGSDSGLGAPNEQKRRMRRRGSRGGTNSPKGAVPQ